MRPLLIYIICTVAFVLLVFLSEGQVSSAVLDAKSMVIKSKGGEDSVQFLSAADVSQLISQQNSGYGLNPLAKELQVRELESALSRSPFVANCEVSLGTNGKIFIDVEEKQALIRVLKPDGTGCYVSKEGSLMPLSTRHTSRALPMMGTDVSLMMRPEYWRSNDGQVLLKMLNFINDNPFWASLVAEIHSKNGQLTILPQVGAQSIMLGTAANYEAKFEKLRLFYKKILPRKGWSEYKTINLAYENQLVCGK